MADVLMSVVAQRIQRTHGWLLKVTEDLPHEQLARRLAPTAPPVEWHLWHIARWADRVQASFPNVPFEPGRRWDPARQIWFRDRLADRWGLDPGALAILETGTAMVDDQAGARPGRIDREALLAYARRAFAPVDAVVAGLGSARLGDDPRNSIMEFVIDERGREFADAPGADTTIAGDLGFYLSHASRHLVAAGGPGSGGAGQHVAVERSVVAGVNGRVGYTVTDLQVAVEGGFKYTGDVHTWQIPVSPLQQPARLKKEAVEVGTVGVFGRVVW